MVTVVDNRRSYLRKELIIIFPLCLIDVSLYSLPFSLEKDLGLSLQGNSQHCYHYHRKGGNNHLFFVVGD